MTPARIAAMDFFDELDQRSIVGKVDEDEIEIPYGAMPPDPDDGDNLPSHIHPSFPYGNPFKDKHLASAAFPTNPYSTRARFEDAEFEGVGLKSKRRWKDLGLDMLLPPDPIKDEEEKAKAARNSVHTSSRRQAGGGDSSEPSAVSETRDEEDEEDEQVDLDGEDEESRSEEEDADAGVAAGVVVLYKLSSIPKVWWIDPYFSPLKDLPGPEAYDSIIWGNFKTIISRQNSVVHEEWLEKLATKDPRAIAHILNNASNYPKPPQIREGLQKLFGQGLLFAEGEEHRRQQKIMNPSFSPAQVRNLLPVFYDNANELKRIWLCQIEDGDIVGLAGFGYDFNCLADGEKNELVRACLELFAHQRALPLLDLMANWFPILGRIPTESSRRTARSKGVRQGVGRKLLKERQAMILAEASDEAGCVAKSALSEKDVFSVMIRANMAKDLKDSERMTDDEVIDQIATIVIAGHETTGTSLDWLLYELARPEINISNPSFEKSSFQIKAGEQVFINIAALNRDKAVWGDDALDFDPVRWLDEQRTKSVELQSIFSRMMTFLAGPRACIGYRFALMEIKVLVFGILREIMFDLPSPTPSIENGPASLIPPHLFDTLQNSPSTLWKTVGIVFGSVAILRLLKLAKRWLIDPQRSPLKDLPGPELYESVIFGNLKRVIANQSSVIHEEWYEQYGHVIQYRGFLLSRRLATKDPKALAYILNHADAYPKPPQMREGFQQILGNGLLSVEGTDHRRQRRIMNPSFGPAQLRDIMPIFYDKAYELKNTWTTQIEAEQTADEIDTDALAWLNRATLDIIGLAGFGYDFNSLAEGKKNELAQAFARLFTPPSRIPFLEILAERIPILRIIPTEGARTTAESKAVMARVGRQLVEEKRAAVLAEASLSGGLQKEGFKGKDILSVIVKANMATDVKDTEKMSDQEVMDQISTMLVAGHETTSSTLSWLLYDLAQPQHKGVQVRLSQELLAVETDRPSMEEINALPYLDAVIREMLRMNSVLDTTARIATKDDVIPLATPFVDRNGVERWEIRINRGEQIAINITAVNRDKSLWGEDSFEFKPERWLEANASPTPAQIPGVFSSLLTFLGGPRACIGYRFAILEMKIIVFVLLRQFVVELQTSNPRVEKGPTLITRPMIKATDGTITNMMPLKLRLVQDS
ncbi:hypothetical protein FRB90_009782 [Tulasnella sp. 427]|nr:hypothetical protein FRB90_009782 [Tulasnella sp. 427]